MAHRSNTSGDGAGFAQSDEYARYDALPTVVKRAFQNAPADFSVAGLVPYGPFKTARRRLDDADFAAWLEEQFILTYRETILPKCNFA